MFVQLVAWRALHEGLICTFMQTTAAFRTAVELGVLVKRARIAADLRQRDAADLCGVSERFLIQLEQGKPGSRLELVLKVCRGLGVSLEARIPEGSATSTSTTSRRRRPRIRRPVGGA